MASTISPYCMFNRKLIDFIADLKPIIGHMPEYALVLSSVKMLDKIDAPPLTGAPDKASAARLPTAPVLPAAHPASARGRRAR